MARHRRASRMTFALLAAVAVVAVGIVILKSEPAGAKPSQLAQDTPSPILTTPIEGQVAQAPPKVELLRTIDNPAAPTTVPTTNPSGSAGAIPPRAAPEGDPETIFRNATAKRDAGDLVTARDMVNDALQAGRFSGSDAQEAKAFIGTLNEKIILGTQKFTADAYNKQWKVEPGTVLVKLAKRFDVTAELLCRVNGLSSPHKLKAGVTIKAIQGPFHLVVSKSRFEADLYLGNAGGANSMYLKTVRVGLGSDGSTPTGTWKVETGKVTNPVYYSPRGEGVVAADDPKNPLGERWIPLTGIEGDCVGKESYGIHGTIEPDSIGKNMSLGCIRLLDEDVKLLYDLLVEQKSTVKVID